MFDLANPILIFVAAIGSGIVGGIFYGFSSFVMPALSRLPSAHGVAAMNAINVAVITPSFMIVFMGTALVSLLVAGSSFFWWSQTGAKLTFAASLINIVGCFGVTMFFNVPLNEWLADVEPDQEEALWAHYLDRWTLWNHVRAAASVVAAVLFTAVIFLV
jgi:uncharacterized membrane protein